MSTKIPKYCVLGAFKPIPTCFGSLATLQPRNQRIVPSFFAIVELQVPWVSIQQSTLNTQQSIISAIVIVQFIQHLSRDIKFVRVKAITVGSEWWAVSFRTMYVLLHITSPELCVSRSFFFKDRNRRSLEGVQCISYAGVLGPEESNHS